MHVWNHALKLLGCGIAQIESAATHHRVHHAGFHFRRWDGGGLSAVYRLCRPLRSTVRRGLMIFDYTLASIVTVGLMVYLVYALLKPERF
jgi:K+-transporting ATPase KdpF subunit